MKEIWLLQDRNGNIEDFSVFLDERTANKACDSMNRFAQQNKFDTRFRAICYQPKEDSQ
jgi:hypothetical protein